MSNLPTELRYASSHEWLRHEADGSVTIGITDHAQELLGDLVFVELPEIGRQLATAEGCAVVESVKAASDIYAPIAGSVIEVNDAVEESPELVNQDPYGSGWLIKLQPVDSDQISTLLDATGYQALVAEE